MADPREIALFQVDQAGHPALWKAQQSFLSAEKLRAIGKLDCAANRYYYAVLHVACEFFTYRNPEGQGWKHGDLAAKYLREQDAEAQEAFSRAQDARNRADYTPHPVMDKKLVWVIMPVVGMITRAMDRRRIPKGKQ
jgi:hypothetical protein